ncbi:hypothetical protein CYMTET_52004 [Cymbomonas tetramitiformis]|uniref:Uncharacterized protein n=1 Tax=Cymbomonas tetramitiformis TaxID=36881 RepID=A0AAE0ER86_9CHLO|nr:hypothetical protein CYMTET_52004 [Cymbomonas tetramitiformis]
MRCIALRWNAAEICGSAASGSRKVIFQNASQCARNSKPLFRKFRKAAECQRFKRISCAASEPQNTTSWIRLGALGTTLGPCVDAIHNQALLQYDAFPVSVEVFGYVAKSSLLIPPLLGIAYIVIGGVLPRFASRLVGTASISLLPALKDAAPATRALAAVTTTALIVKGSELLVVNALPLPALPILFSAALLQWIALDGAYSTLALALTLSVLGPISETPFLCLHCWHYISPDYWPLASVGLGPGSPAGLAAITGPCYFAVTTDAVALARWCGVDLRHNKP